MSGWHREHPDLAGTDADPWMSNPGYAAAAREVQMYQQFPNLDAMIAQAEEQQRQTSHHCEECSEPQPAADACRECGGRLIEWTP